MAWLKENWGWILGAAGLLAWFGVLWLMNENGTIKTWAEKPLSKATLGDVASIVIFAAFIIRK